MEAKILLVDDENAIRKMLTRYLEGAGYTCRTAENVDSAKKILASETFDLLLSDLKMPGESGLTLLKHAKEHYPKMGRVMITGFAAPEIASEILTVGVYGYIIKPLTRDMVLITVENALRHLWLNLHLLAYKSELEHKISRRTEKLTAIMNHLNVGVVMLDTDMKILEINRKMQQFFPGVSSSKPKFCYQVFNSPDCEEICEDCTMATTLQTGESCESVRRLETTQGKRDFRIVTSPILDKNGLIYAGIALYDDITEKLVLERDLYQAQKLESVGQLAAGIAHEINSPIQYVGDNLSFLQDTFKDLVKVLDSYESSWSQLQEAGIVPEDLNLQLSKAIEEADLDYLKEEIPQTLDQSHDGVQRVDKIVRAMKEFSHPGGDEKTMMSINKIIDSTITVCRNEWKYAAELSMDLSPDLPVIPCFAGEISQVLLNIIVNASHAISDFTEDGSKGMGKISISTMKTDNGIQIRISDTGGGIPEKIRDRIFDPFFTTKERGKGTGQGLSIAYRAVVEKHQGGLSFESEIGQGTTFIIDLPSK
jgi:signal transduction histidine kinase/DNA-binding response OmpR family regulator